MCKPKYSLVHRGHFEMEQHMMGESAMGAQVDSCRPRELIVKIQLPRCNRAGDVDLDVSAERLVLQVEEKYDLLLDLPFPGKSPFQSQLLVIYRPGSDRSLVIPVDEENGSAKFDKTMHTMTVTLPVVKEETPVQVAPALMEVTKENETEDPDAIPEELAALLDDGDGVLVEVGAADGGAGFTCSDDDGVLIVDGIAPQGSSDNAGVSKGMRLVAFEAGSHSWCVFPAFFPPAFHLLSLFSTAFHCFLLTVSLLCALQEHLAAGRGDNDLGRDVRHRRKRKPPVAIHIRTLG